MSVKRCDTSKRRRRRSATAVGLTQGSSTEVNINIPPTTLGLFVNATPEERDECIAYSEFNLTSPGTVPLVLRIIPDWPRTVIAFVRRNFVPTSTEYDWLLTMWDNTDNFTLYIAANETKDANRIYVGVQFSKSTLIVLYTVVLLILVVCNALLLIPCIQVVCNRVTTY